MSDKKNQCHDIADELDACSDEVFKSITGEKELNRTAFAMHLRSLAKKSRLFADVFNEVCAKQEKK